MSELISVVIPVYNCAPYLDECLQSLEVQTWSEWEAILVDDGSTDDSPARCDAWAGYDSRIRVIHQPNAGVSAARNAGIAAAKGPYLAFVDADDWVEPRYLQKLYDGIQFADIAVCGLCGQLSTDLIPGLVSVRKMQETPSVYTALAYSTCCFNKLYRLGLIQKVGLRMPTSMKRGEDVWFVAQYYALCEKACIIPENLYHYRDNTDSATHKFHSGVCQDETIVMKTQYDFFHKYPLTEYEDQAFNVWEYGKTLSVLRYIVTYSPQGQSVFWLKKIFENEQIKQSFLAPPDTVGFKARLAATLLKFRLYGSLSILLQYI